MDESQPELVNAEQSTFDLANSAYEVVKNNWKAFAVVNIFAVFSAITATFGLSTPEEDAEREVRQFILDLPNKTAEEIGSIVLFVLGVAIVATVVGAFLQAMNLNLQIKTSQGEHPTVGELLADGRKYFWRTVLLSVAAGTIIVVGLILLIIPGLIAINRLLMSGFHMVEKDLSVTEAMKASNRQAKQHSEEIWKVLGVVIVLGLAAAFVGLVPIAGAIVSTVALIVVEVIIVMRYQQLKLPNYPAKTNEDLPSSQATT